jgi:hypothetical protein
LNPFLAIQNPKPLFPKTPYPTLGSQQAQPALAANPAQRVATCSSSPLNPRRSPASAAADVAAQLAFRPVSRRQPTRYPLRPVVPDPDTVAPPPWSPTPARLEAWPARLGAPSELFNIVRAPPGPPTRASPAPPLPSPRAARTLARRRR